MEIDKTTINDLSIFNADEQLAICDLLEFATTDNGKAQWYRHLSTPLSSIDRIKDTQLTIQQVGQQLQHWPKHISNGTIKVVERYYDTAIDPIPLQVNTFNAASYKLIHGPDYSLVKYSFTHCFDFIKGMKKIVELLLQPGASAQLAHDLNDANEILSKGKFELIYKAAHSKEIKPVPMLQLSQHLRFRLKQQILRLLDIHARIDGWYSMAMAVEKYNLVFPELSTSEQPFIQSEGLYHLLLKTPVAYDITLNRETNFLFLTGANMAGKSTFIKSIGVAAFLAHVGMGVPAKSMSMSLFDGMLSNINVTDNILKGESFFYNEVQRIKSTLHRINDGRKWLILIDELFKGTNVQDAMKCSSLVIEGLLKMRNSIFILSTHLYEIGEPLRIHPNIRFNYFETDVKDDQLQFSYQLKEGISNDRFGYLILKKEGVVKMLESL